MTPIYYVIGEYVQNMPQNMYGVTMIHAIYETTLEEVINGRFSSELAELNMQGKRFTTFMFVRVPSAPFMQMTMPPKITYTREFTIETQSLEPQSEYPEPKEEPEQWRHPAEDL